MEQQQDRAVGIQGLPEEVLLDILGRLDDESVVSAAHVCSYWRWLCRAGLRARVARDVPADILCELTEDRRDVDWLLVWLRWGRSFLGQKVRTDVTAAILDCRDVAHVSVDGWTVYTADSAGRLRAVDVRSGAVVGEASSGTGRSLDGWCHLRLEGLMVLLAAEGVSFVRTPGLEPVSPEPNCPKIRGECGLCSGFSDRLLLMTDDREATVLRVNMSDSLQVQLFRRRTRHLSFFPNVLFMSI